MDILEELAVRKIQAQQRLDCLCAVNIHDKTAEDMSHLEALIISARKELSAAETAIEFYIASAAEQQGAG
jgi:hypothetical protein